MYKTVKTMVKKAEPLGWKVEKSDEGYFFSKPSPAGQDFNFETKGHSPQDVIDSILEVIQKFDCSEEAYLWLDNSGHGKNGAPYDMRDVYEDMEACVAMTQDLHTVLSGDEPRRGTGIPEGMTFNKDKIVMLPFTETYKGIGYEEEMVAIFHADKLTEKEAHDLVKRHGPNNRTDDRILFMTQKQYQTVFLTKK